MNINTFPLPVSGKSVDFGTDDIIDEYIKEVIEPNVFDEETLFVVLLIGENPGGKRSEIFERLKDDRAVERADKLAKIDVATIGEKRLNDFALSLLHNCLATDSSRSPADIVDDENIIADDVRRKIDFYLPRIHERVEDVSRQLKEDFNERRSTLFPVEPSSEAARDLYQTLDDDIVSHDPIVDYILLAGATSEAPRLTENIIQHIRKEDLDNQGLLSKTGNAAGYSRIFSNAYNLTSDELFPRFRETVSLYESGISKIQTLSSLYVAPNYETIYSIDHPAEKLLVSQFSGRDQELARYIFEAALVSQIVSQNADVIAEEYKKTRDELNEKIEEVNKLTDDAKELDDAFKSEKIKYNANSPAFLASSLVTEVSKSDTAIIQFLFGVDRKTRTSVFTTVKKHLEDERQKLSTNISTIRSRVDRIEELEAELESLLDRVEELYTNIEDSTVDVTDLPDRSTVIDHIESEWEEKIDHGISSLSEVDVSQDQNKFMQIDNDWGEQIGTIDEELDELRSIVDRLDDLRQHISEIENERSAGASKLSTIDSTLGGDA